MLRELPFQTIGDVARHGLELHVYCSRCFATRRLDLEMNTALYGRAFATTRFRCRRCGTPGLPKIRPAELLPVGGAVTLAFLWCNSCIWEIDQAQLNKAAMVRQRRALSLPWLWWPRGVAHTWASLAARRAVIDGCRWIGLVLRMPQDAAAKLEQILTEADDLIRRRLKESGLEVMHVTLAITENGFGVVRTNVGPELLRSMAEELVDLSSRIEPPRPGDAKH
jgi:hypothetical protein